MAVQTRSMTRMTVTCNNQGPVTAKSETTSTTSPTSDCSVVQRIIKPFRTRKAAKEALESVASLHAVDGSTPPSITKEPPTTSKIKLMKQLACDAFAIVKHISSILGAFGGVYALYNMYIACNQIDEADKLTGARYTVEFHKQM